ALAEQTDDAALKAQFEGVAKSLADSEARILEELSAAQGTAQAIQRALTMPIEERRQRHDALMAIVRKTDVHWWRTRFLDALTEAA
ncbi:NADP-dependent isocitrate dehydrogenase, partial [Paraburkholderia sp. SIMBA_050]